MSEKAKRYNVWGKGIVRDWTLFGKWIRENKLNQQYLIDISSINSDTVGKLCTDSEYKPSNKMMSRTVSALRRHGYEVSIMDFWNYEPLSVFDLWLLNNGIKQETLAREASISESTINKIRKKTFVSESVYKKSVLPIINTLNRLGYPVNADDFWSHSEPREVFEEEDEFFTPLDEWLADHDFNYSEFAKLCDLSVETVRSLCSDRKYYPSGKSIKKIMEACRKIDPEITPVDLWKFWD